MAVDLADPLGSLDCVDAAPTSKRLLEDRRVRLFLIAGLVLALFGVAVMYKRSTGRAVHDYDSGPVRTESDTTTGIQAEIGEIVTFGGIILDNFSDRPAVLESIRFDPPLDSGMTLVDVKVAGRDRGIGMVGADRGFPPSGMPASAIQPLPGAIVPPEQGDDRWGVEVLMAFKLNKPGQFGFHQAIVDYRIGDKRHRIRAEDGFVICGGPEYPRCDLDAFRKVQD